MFWSKFEVYVNLKSEEPEALWSCRIIMGYDSSPATKGYAYGSYHKIAQTSYAFHTYHSQSSIWYQVDGTAQFLFILLVFSRISHPRQF